MKTPIVTEHAKKRIKERLHLPKRIADKNAQTAFTDGICHDETAGSLKRYCDFLFFQTKKADNIRIYNDCVYIFCGTTLITVFLLPQKYKKTVKSIRQKRRESTKEEKDAESTKKAVRSRRMAVGTAVAVLMLLMLCVLAVSGESKEHDYERIAVRVAYGDTAWSIAQRYCPDDVDVREYLQQCADENGLSSMGNLRAGENYIFLAEKE